MIDTGDTSMYWEIQTDFTTRPIRLLVDTGAQLTLISKKLIKKFIELNADIFSLTGISGLNHAITTKGGLSGNIITENTKWPIEVHTVDDDYKGQFDGYLGLDFMMKYGAILNLGDLTFTLHSGMGDIVEITNENKNWLPLEEPYEESEDQTNLDASCNMVNFAGENNPSVSIVEIPQNANNIKIPSNKSSHSMEKSTQKAPKVATDKMSTVHTDQAQSDQNNIANGKMKIEDTPKNSNKKENANENSKII